MSIWVSDTEAYSIHWLIHNSEEAISTLIYGKAVALPSSFWELWKLCYFAIKHPHKNEKDKFPRKEGFITWINL